MSDANAIKMSQFCPHQIALCSHNPKLWALVICTWGTAAIPSGSLEVVSNYPSRSCEIASRCESQIARQLGGFGSGL